MKFWTIHHQLCKIRHPKALRVNEKMGMQRVDKKAVVLKAYKNAYKKFGMTDSEAAAVIGKTRSTLAKSAGFSTTSKEHELQVLFIRLYRSLYAILGGDEKAMKHWFCTSNKHLRGTPKEMVNRIVGLTDINAYLDTLRAKV